MILSRVDYREGLRCFQAESITFEGTDLEIGGINGIRMQPMNELFQVFLAIPSGIGLRKI